MAQFEFRTPPHIIFGCGAATQLASHIQKIHTGNRVFIITDRGVVEAGLVAPVQAALDGAGFEVCVYEGIVADPPETIILEALEQARRAGAQIIIGFGGGSSMDAAKLVAVLMDSEQSLGDIYGIDAIIGERNIALILVATTAGTGSEVTPISVVTTGQSTKMSVIAPQLYADIAILDPALTLGLPPAVTAATGIDAMVHAIEAYTSRHRKNPMSDQFARSALALLSGSIVRAVRDGQDRQARFDMLLGAMWAGQAFANAPVAAVHALAYPIGSIFHVAHGLSNALVLPHIMKFNLPAAAVLYGELAEVIAPKGARAGGSDIVLAAQFIDQLEAICIETGIERRLRDVGIGEGDIDRLADGAMRQTRLLANNPRVVARADAYDIYKAAY